MRQTRQQEEQAWERRLAGTGLNPVDLVRRLEEAGYVGRYETRLDARRMGFTVVAFIHVSMERNMECAIVSCGHCQFGGSFVCKDGPVYRFDRIAHLFFQREV